MITVKEIRYAGIVAGIFIFRAVHAFKAFLEMKI